MKRTTICLAGALAVFPLFLSLAADPAPSSADAPAQQPTAAPAPVISGAPPASPVKLPYGVEDVLKLSKAQISDDIILNYVRGTGTIYNLTPKDIVYLRDQGVSEKVINAMLNQRNQVEVAAQNGPAPVTSIQNAPTVANAPSVADASVAQQAPVYTEGSPVYATAPLTPPASTTYVIPYGYSYPAYDPYWYGGWYGPSIVLGFGGGYYGHHYYGGHGWGGHGYYGGHGSVARGGGGGGHGGGHR